jgi:signal transduction histidine kinase
MRLVQKLLLWFLAGISCVLAINGVLRVRREVGLFESHRVQSHDVMARALATTIGDVWRLRGEEEALRTIERFDKRTNQLAIRWIPAGATQADPTERCATTTVPGAEERGTLALCEPAEIRDAYVRRTIIETILTTLALALVCAGIAGVVGVSLVGRPVRALMTKAQRIGAGDFSGPLELRGGDELAALAAEMNRTCERLVEASAKVEAETASRIAAIEQLRHADRLMTVGKLASGLAHELGTPLNVVQARAEMIASGEASAEESSSYAGAIIEASQRMAKILRQLLDFARARGAEKAPVDVLAIARRTVGLVRPIAAKRKVDVVVTGEEARALVDAAQIEQVLANVIVNAIHATPIPPGDDDASRSPRTVDVDVACTRARRRDVAHAGAGPKGAAAAGAERDFVRVRVRDRGVGIAAEDLAHIFEPFFTTKDVGEGTGLGLAVAYGIVEEHGGWIDVKSERNAGSTFAIYLATDA